MQAIRQALLNLSRDQGAHAGLLLRRYLKYAVPSPGATRNEKESHQNDRRQLHVDVSHAAAASQTLYALAYGRWKTLIPSDSNCLLPVQGRLIMGLGGENVLETGLTLHHTYGIPFIPGSALKGLSSHYCDQVWGLRPEADSTRLTEDNHKFRRLRYGEKRGHNGIHPDTGVYHEILFGTTDDSGHIIFHDAWIHPESLTGQSNSGTVSDVMTPHHGDYYSGATYKEGANKGALIPPTDFDDPNPVTFMSVTGTFHVAVSCDAADAAGQKWAKLAFDLLTEALREWGVGGKTSSGYGRLGRISNDSTSLRVSAAPANKSSSNATSKRPSGTPAQVKVVEPRPKGGFTVQESGRPPGTLTLGPCPGPPPKPGDVVDVLVHVDNAGTPQYKWPDPNATPRKQKNRKGNRQ